MKGFVNVFKPSGMTSSDVVVKVRGILRIATGEKQKVGHLGTLDPLAIGVLPIAIGNATRLFDYMQDKVKVYEATFKFGVTTDTLDCDGTVTDTQNVIVSKNDIEGIIEQLVGSIEQMPPQYSAKSVGGRRAYDIAREGGVANLKPKTVQIHSIELLGNANQTIKLSRGEITLSENEFAFRITCGSGTYIRAIARDMASLLGTVGYMTSLCRIQSGTFTLESAVSLKDFEASPLSFVQPIDIGLSDYPIVDLNSHDGERALNGISIPYSDNVRFPFVVSICGDMVGIGEIKDGKLKIRTRL